MLDVARCEGGVAMCRLNDGSETVNILLLCGWRVVAERMRRTLTNNMCKYKVVCMCLLGGSPYGVVEDTLFARREGCWHKAGNEDWFRWWNFPIDLSC